jgi:hypothetical protein
MIHLLPDTAWREFRGVPKKGGLNRTTHIAGVEDSSGQIHRCYVKICPPNFASPITEAVAYLLLESLGLPRPDFAALILVTLAKLRAHLQLDQHWLNYPPFVLGFCASEVVGKGPALRWTKRALNRPDTAKLAAFDLWIENQDRNSGNVLRASDGSLVPIDHEYSFYSQVWHGKVPFSISLKTLFMDAAAILKTADNDSFRVAAAVQFDHHGNALASAAPDIQGLLTKIISDASQANIFFAQLNSFLALRAPKSWAAGQLGVIV